MRVALQLLFAAAVALASTAACAAPKELYGKSVVVTWNEDRLQRVAGQSDFQSRNVSGGLSVYISTEGNVFNRRSAQAVALGGRGRRGGKVLQGANDQVGSSGGRVISFQGHTMTAIGTRGANGALLISVTFDASFSSCTAQVIHGKQEGAAEMVGNSLVRPGTKVEVQSAHTSGETCSVRDGNVFAD